MINVVWNAEIGVFLCLALITQMSNFSCILLHALRLKTVLSDFRIEFPSLFGITLMYIGASALLPARLGEFVRPAMLQKRHGVPLPVSAAAIAHLQVAEVLVLLFILAFLSSLLKVYFTDDVLQPKMIVITFSAVLVITAVMAIFVLPVSRVRPFLSETLRYFSRGVHAEKIIINVFLTVCAWAMSLCTIYFVLEIFSIKGDLVSLLLIFVGIMVGSLLPVLPGAAGTFEIGVVLGARYLDISLIDSFAVALVLRGAFFAVPVACLLFSFGFHFRDRLLSR